MLSFKEFIQQLLLEATDLSLILGDLGNKDDLQYIKSTFQKDDQRVWLVKLYKAKRLYDTDKDEFNKYIVKNSYIKDDPIFENIKDDKNIKIEDVIPEEILDKLQKIKSVFTNKTSSEILKGAEEHTDSVIDNQNTTDQHLLFYDKDGFLKEKVIKSSNNNVVLLGSEGEGSARNSQSKKEILEKSKEELKGKQYKVYEVPNLKLMKVDLDYGDGFIMFEFPQGFDHGEAASMGHCGGVPYSGGRFFSLRKVSKKGKYTVHDTKISIYVKKNGDIQEIRGPANVNPTKEYSKYIVDWIDKRGFVIDDDTSGFNKFVYNIAKTPKEKHLELANKLIEKGYEKSVVANLDKFEGLDVEFHKNLANKLIEDGYGGSVANNLDKFKGLNHKEIANKIIEKGDGSFVGENLDKFEGLDKEIANKLIENGDGSSVAYNLDKFEGLDHLEIANKLIEKGKGGIVADNLDKFEGLNHKDLANKLIEKGKGRYVAYNLKEFEGLNHIDIANKLIENGDGGSVADNLEKFEGLNHIEIANKLIERLLGYYVANNLAKFEGLNHIDIANKLIEKGEGRYVANNLKKFEGLNHIDIANKLIEKGDGGSVVKNIDKFEGLNHVEIANKLIEKGLGDSVAYNLDKFEGLDAEIANKLIEKGYENYVAENLDKFKGLNHIEIANKLIENGYGDSVAENLDKFKGLDVEFDDFL